MQVDSVPEDDEARQSYNFAPGYNGIVYRADVPSYGAGERLHRAGQTDSNEVAPQASSASQPEPQFPSSAPTRYKLQSMRWGLIPFWTKRSPDYGSMLRTINCRDDSLAQSGGMWNTMKQKKRCVVVAQGFYEWLKPGHGGNKGKDKLPHFIKRKDGKLMCMAGLWDCAQYEGSEEKIWSYTIITREATDQMAVGDKGALIHDRMVCVLDTSEQMKRWLDPKHVGWDAELQSLLAGFKGELEIYPVKKEVGKVGNNDPSFIIPLDSKENKQNIVNFFGPANLKKEEKSKLSSTGKAEGTPKEEDKTETRKTVDHEGTEDNAPLPLLEQSTEAFIKTEGDDAEKALKQEQDVAEQNTPSPQLRDSGKKTLKRERSKAGDRNEPPAKSAKNEEKDEAISTRTRNHASIAPLKKSAAPSRRSRNPNSNNSVAKTPPKKDRSQKIDAFFS